MQRPLFGAHVSSRFSIEREAWIETDHRQLSLFGCRRLLHSNRNMKNAVCKRRLCPVVSSFFFGFLGSFSFFILLRTSDNHLLVTRDLSVGDPRRPECTCSRALLPQLDANFKLGPHDTRASLCNAYATRRGPHQRVISISLFGPKEEKRFQFQRTIRYLHLLIRDVNLRYSDGFILRIYHDDTINVTDVICPIECQYSNVDFCSVTDKLYIPPKIWRFIPAGDPLVDISTYAHHVLRTHRNSSTGIRLFLLVSDEPWSRFSINVTRAYCSRCLARFEQSLSCYARSSKASNTYAGWNVGLPTCTQSIPVSSNPRSNSQSSLNWTLCRPCRSIVSRCSCLAWSHVQSTRARQFPLRRWFWSSNRAVSHAATIRKRNRVFCWLYQTMLRLWKDAIQTLSAAVPTEEPSRMALLLVPLPSRSFSNKGRKSQLRWTAASLYPSGERCRIWRRRCSVNVAKEYLWLMVKQEEHAGMHQWSSSCRTDIDNDKSEDEEECLRARVRNRDVRRSSPQWKPLAKIKIKATNNRLTSWK